MKGFSSHPPRLENPDDKIRGTSKISLCVHACGYAMIVAGMKVALKWDKILGSSRFLLSLIRRVIVLILWIKEGTNIYWTLSVYYAVNTLYFH